MVDQVRPEDIPDEQEIHVGRDEAASMLREHVLTALKSLELARQICLAMVDSNTKDPAINMQQKCAAAAMTGHMVSALDMLGIVYNEYTIRMFTPPTRTAIRDVIKQQKAHHLANCDVCRKAHEAGEQPEPHTHRERPSETPENFFDPKIKYQNPDLEN